MVLIIVTAHYQERIIKTMIEIAEQIDILNHYLEISAWFYYKDVAQCFQL